MKLRDFVAEMEEKMNNSKGKKVLALVCAVGLVLGTNGSAFRSEAAKKPVFLSKTKATMSVGKSQTIQVKKAAKVKIKKKTFSSSDKSIVTVSKTGKVSAKKAGTATIKAKIQYVKKPGKKVKTANLKCKITVTGQDTNANTTPNPNATPDPNATPNTNTVKAAGVYDLNGQMLKTWAEMVAEGIVEVKDGVLTKFVSFPVLSSGYDLVIGDGVTSIGKMVFYDFYSINSVVIPEGVVTIETNAFSGCERMKSVTLPKSLRSIGERAFTACYELADVTLPDGLTTIGNEAFNLCKVAVMKVPSSVTTIGYSAFSGIPLVIYDGSAEYMDWGAKQVQKSDGTIVYQKD